LPKELGIDETTVQQHRSEIVKTAMTDLDEDDPMKSGTVPDEIEYWINADRVGRVISANCSLISPIIGIISIRLPGTPSIMIKSESNLPFMAPWVIEVYYPFMARPQQFVTYSTELSRIILDMFHDTLTSSIKQLLHPSQLIWTSPMWNKIPDIKEPLLIYRLAKK
jgi:hypothetical protein